jgi:hypothetical protein
LLAATSFFLRGTHTALYICKDQKLNGGKNGRKEGVPKRIQYLFRAYPLCRDDAKDDGPKRSWFNLRGDDEEGY